MHENIHNGHNFGSVLSTTLSEVGYDFIRSGIQIHCLICEQQRNGREAKRSDYDPIGSFISQKVVHNPVVTLHK